MRQLLRDCFFPHGVPFTLFGDSGFGGGGGLVWFGLTGDVLLTLAGGALASWVISGILKLAPDT